MARRPSNFRQQDVARAIKAAKSAGLEIVRIDVDPKTARITVIVSEQEKQNCNPWDDATMAPMRKAKTRKITP